MRRGEIWWGNLPEPEGSEPGYRRPLLILQSDRFTKTAIGTVIVVTVTTNLRLADAPGNVLLPRRATDLPKDSVANVSQVLTVNKRQLTERVGELPSRLLERVEQGVRLVLEL